MAYSENEELVDCSGVISDQEMPTTSVDSLPVLARGYYQRERRSFQAAPQYQPWASVVSNEDADETLEMTVAHLLASLALASGPVAPTIQ